MVFLWVSLPLCQCHCAVATVNSQSAMKTRVLIGERYHCTTQQNTTVQLVFFTQQNTTVQLFFLYTFPPSGAWTFRRSVTVGSHCVAHEGILIILCWQWLCDLCMRHILYIATDLEFIQIWWTNTPNLEIWSTTTEFSVVYCWNSTQRT